MNYTQSKDQLLSLIREGGKLDWISQVKLTALLSFPSMLAQMVHILMQYIDAAMVGSLGAHASASIGLVSTSIWLFGSLCAAVSVGFYVQVAHKIGANDFAGARQVLRQSFLSCILFALMLSCIGVSVSSYLPHWLGGGEDICHDASLYFMFFSMCLPFSMLNSLCAGMLRCSGNMHVPSILNIAMCLLDVVFNWLLIFPTRTYQWSMFDVQCSMTIPGAGLGVVGAVLGTALAFVICSGLMCYFTVVRSKELSLEGYTTVYLGFPIWWGEEPRILDTFVEKYSFEGITVIPFCTSGSSGIGRSGLNMEALAGSGTWKEGKRFSGNVSEAELKSWTESHTETAGGSAAGTSSAEEPDVSGTPVVYFTSDRSRKITALRRSRTSI